MRKARSLIGMPVIVQNRRVGRVVQPEYSEDLTRLEALWIHCGLRGSRRISAESLSLIGQVSILADERGQRGRCKIPSLFLRAVGTDGQRIGAVTGAVIDEMSFRVEALELSRGFIDDLLCGRALVHHFTLNQENGSVVIGAPISEKEESFHEKRYGEGNDRGSGHRRLGSYDVRRDELAVCPPNESTDEKDGSMDRRQGG